PAVGFVELRRLRVLGVPRRAAPGPAPAGAPGSMAPASEASGSAPVETLKVFQSVAEVTLRRPLRPDEIKALVTGLDFQAEFFTGREFGLRVRGEGILLLHRVRAALQALAGASAAGARGEGPAAPRKSGGAANTPARSQR